MPSKALAELEEIGDSVIVDIKYQTLVTKGEIFRGMPWED